MYRVSKGLYKYCVMRGGCTSLMVSYRCMQSASVPSLNGHSPSCEVALSGVKDHVQRNIFGFPWKGLL